MKMTHKKLRELLSRRFLAYPAYALDDLTDNLWFRFAAVPSLYNEGTWHQFVACISKEEADKFVRGPQVASQEVYP